MFLFVLSEQPIVIRYIVNNNKTLLETIIISNLKIIKKRPGILRDALNISIEPD